MKKGLLFTTAFIFIISTSFSQRLITLEDIWSKNTFAAQSAPGFNFMKDGRHYTLLENNAIQQYDLTTGNVVQTILDATPLSGKAGFNGQMQDYTFSADEQKVLVMSELEPLYRRSYKGKFFVYDRQTKTLEALFEKGKVSLAFFNPQGTKVAFVFDNNLYLKDLASKAIQQITTDGAHNKIINGGMDWVYEEEFALTRGYEWSPDGEKIAYYRFDESLVPEFMLTLYHNESYPDYVPFKYPKVGENNSVISIYLYDVNTGKTVQAETGTETNIYIPRIRWMTNNELCIFRMNRHQDQLELLQTNVNNGATTVIFSEKNKYYIEEETLDNIIFLKDGKSFLLTSERDGWRHIYLASIDGKVQQLTKGNWEVSNVYGVDEAKGMVYYQAAEKSPIERQVYAIGLDGKGKKELASQSGWNGATFSSTFDYFVLNYSTINTPPTYTVYDRNGKVIRVIENNQKLASKMTAYKMSPATFFQFRTKQGNVDLNGWMIKPTDFKENRKYPVLMFVYGGPGSQQVTDAWKGANYLWFQLLAEQGFVVACVDNRGTGGRGEEFKKMTYLQLGKYETMDQIEAAKFLGSQSYVDRNRIGIFGWSYGGYMSSLCILKGNDVFESAIAVAPVTNWKWYDSIYTERYMRTEEENPTGYRDNSPVNFADKLRGNYLLVHGMGDDNVHFQNTAEMANALINANKQYDTYFYPNRNHSIAGGNTRLHLYTKMTQFLTETLKVNENPSQKQKVREGIRIPIEQSTIKQ